MSFGKKPRPNQTIEYKKGKIRQHFAKYLNIKATTWQTIKRQSIIRMKIGIKQSWATNAATSVGKPE